MSDVYFSKDLSSVAKLFDSAGFDKIVTANEPIALKIHFGEPGNTAYLKPQFVKPIADRISSIGGSPFYTDCNTLYHGPRKTTKEHLQVAIDHGFTKEKAGANSQIPEETDQVKIEINQKNNKFVFLGGIVPRTKAMIVLTHFKGHELTGFGGTLKNLGMGLASRLGKLKQHQDCKNCDKVKTCKKNETVEACWGGSPELVQENIVEYAYGAVKDKQVGYINFITDVSPQCDCYPHNEEPIVPDIGVLASFDPVAIDQACADLVNQANGRINGPDKFRSLYPEVDWTVQLRYAEEIGMGSRKYNLIML